MIKTDPHGTRYAHPTPDAEQDAPHPRPGPRGRGPRNPPLGDVERERQPERRGTSTGYGSSVPCSVLPGSGSSAVTVSEDVTFKTS